jgi:hypothetical protein
VGQTVTDERASRHSHCHGSAIGCVSTSRRVTKERVDLGHRRQAKTFYGELLSSGESSWPIRDDEGDGCS